MKNKGSMQGKISASMMCTDLIDLKETVRIFEKEGIEYLHIDVMDGTFVPNFGLGVDYIRGLRRLTDIPLDLHLMIKDPEYKFRWIGIKPEDIVSVHYESTFQVQRALDFLEPYKCKRFLAINPATPVSSLEEVLDYIDGINLLMVNPGFAGQKIVPSTMKKAVKVIDLLKKEGREDIVVEVDGNITPENARKLYNVGARVFVAGTSSIFKGDLTKYTSNIEMLRNCIK
jgi:ribulose-phosphate 3-epimerase